MRLTTTAAAVLTYLFFQASSAEAAISCEWPGRGGVASAVSASDDGVYVLGASPVGAGFPIYRWKNDRFETQSGGVYHLAVARHDLAWATDIFYRPWRFDGTNWVMTGGLGGEIAVGGNPLEVFILGIGEAADHAGYAIWRLKGDHWEMFGGGAEKIAVDPEGFPVIVRKDRSIARWNGSTWIDLPGEAREIAVGAGGHLWKIGVIPQGGGYSIEYWDGRAWQLAPGGAVKIAVRRNGQPWVVNAVGQSYEGICAIP